VPGAGIAEAKFGITAFFFLPCLGRTPRRPRGFARPDLSQLKAPQTAGVEAEGRQPTAGQGAIKADRARQPSTAGQIAGSRQKLSPMAIATPGHQHLIIMLGDAPAGWPSEPSKARMTTSGDKAIGHHAAPIPAQGVTVIGTKAGGAAIDQMRCPLGPALDHRWAANRTRTLVLERQRQTSMGALGAWRTRGLDPSASGNGGVRGRPAAPIRALGSSPGRPAPWGVSADHSGFKLRARHSPGFKGQ